MMVEARVHFLHMFEFRIHFFCGLPHCLEHARQVTTAASPILECPVKILFSPLNGLRKLEIHFGLFSNLNPYLKLKHLADITLYIYILGNMSLVLIVS